jgi:hypothetical protein
MLGVVCKIKTVISGSAPPEKAFIAMTEKYLLNLQ